MCNTGWKCEGYNYMGKRIDGTCNRDSAHKTQFQMTCDDDGRLGITEAETVDVGTPINDLKEEKEVTTKRKKAE